MGHLDGSWLSQLSIRLWLRSWSRGYGFKPCMELCADSSGPGDCFGFCVSLSLCSSPAHALSLSKINIRGAPGWLSRLSVRLRLRSWSYGSLVRALHRALCWQPGACFGFCVSLSLSLSLSLPFLHSCSVSLCLKNKQTLKKIFFKVTKIVHRTLIPFIQIHEKFAFLPH